MTSIRWHSIPEMAEGRTIPVEVRAEIHRLMLTAILLTALTRVEAAHVMQVVVMVATATTAVAEMEAGLLMEAAVATAGVAVVVAAEVDSILANRA